MTETTNPLSERELDLMNAYWRAANYLSVGQIYLMDNPLLKEPLSKEHVKPRLLGHWGTTPGLNFLYVHLNRIIRNRDLDIVYIAGPGHGGPALVANVWLEGTYSEYYPDVSFDEAGMTRLFRQFSFPGGIPSHVAPETPGSIHEGGELGYSIAHAYGAVFDNPDLITACVVGDGEELLFRGECPGTITTRPIGSNGFGYDPIFLYEPTRLTFGQMDKAAKNAVSHRGKAMKLLIEELSIQSRVT